MNNFDANNYEDILSNLQLQLSEYEMLQVSFNNFFNN